MASWMVEVKSGERYKVNVNVGRYNFLHIYQAALRNIEEELKDDVTVQIEVGEYKFDLTKLNSSNRQVALRGIGFDQEFTISHNMRNGSIHLFGYLTRRRYPANMNVIGLCMEAAEAQEAYKKIEQGPHIKDVMVRGGEVCDVRIPAEDKVVAIKKAYVKEVGEVSTDKVVVKLHVIVNGEKLLAGFLHPLRGAELALNMTIDKDFQLFHSLTNGIICFTTITGRKFIPSVTTDSGTDDEEEVPLKKVEARPSRAGESWMSNYKPAPEPMTDLKSKDYVVISGEKVEVDIPPGYRAMCILKASIEETYEEIDEPVSLHIYADYKKQMAATLQPLMWLPLTCLPLNLDLFLFKNVVISHTLKNGSVRFSTSLIA